MSSVVLGRATMGNRATRWLALSLSVFAMAVASVASAKNPLPRADKQGSADDPLLGRYSGSLILSYERRSLGEFVLPTGKLVAVQQGAEKILSPSSQKTIEGKRTHFLYYVGKEISPLEVVRSYQEEAKSQGGSVLFECKEAACGGSATTNVWRSDPGMLNFLYPTKKALSKYQGSEADFCALYPITERLQYTTIDLGGGRGFAAIAAYVAQGGAPADCNDFLGSTFVSVDLLDTTPRKSRMVNVRSAEIASALQSSGKIALYGIYFDVDKTELKPDSDATLKEIAKLMTEKPTLKLVVAGHTDNQGTFAANLDLSQRRAAAVVSALTRQYGIKQDRLMAFGASSAAPVAPNKTDEGRAKNRRVELVEQ